MPNLCPSEVVMEVALVISGQPLIPGLAHPCEWFDSSDERGGLPDSCS